MTNGLTGIIAELEQRRAAIERALAALREFDASATATQIESSEPVAPTLKRRSFSAAVRRKMALAQQARWARIKGENEPTAPAASEPATPKRRISAEGMKRIIAATKKRWRLIREAAKSGAKKKAVRKTTVAKKTIVKAKAAKRTAPVKKTAVKKSAAVPVPTPPLAQTAD